MGDAETFEQIGRLLCSLLANVRAEDALLVIDSSVIDYSLGSRVAYGFPYQPTPASVLDALGKLHEEAQP